jgi:hypothetical protein
MNWFRGMLICLLLGTFSARATQSGAASSSNPATLPAGTALVVELTKSADAKKAKVGDPVKAKLIQDLIIHGQIAAPQGSKIQGVITEVKTRSGDAQESVLQFIFKKMVLKGGRELTFDAVVEAVAPPREDPLTSISSSSYSGTSGGDGSPTSGGGRRSYEDPRVLRDQMRAEAMKNASDPRSYGTGMNPTPHGWLTAGSRGVFGMRALSLKSGMFYSTKSNVKLDSGDQMVLQVIGSHPL